MAAQRMTLRMIKDILRLKWEAEHSHEQIARALSVSKGVVSKYVGLAGAAGLVWPAVREMEERELQALLVPDSPRNAPVVQPDWARVHQELSRKGVTLMLLWQEYVAEHAHERTWRYTQFCAHYKAFAASLKRSMRQTRQAGEKLFIDFAGKTMPLSDGSVGHVFVAAMGASSYTFACATPTERLADWIDGMTRALAFYGGVPQLIVPDNARALIANPDRYEPRANDTVLDFARHYGTSVLPARPYSPRDKGSVESGVQVVSRWILARLRNHALANVYALDRAIAELLPSLNDRPFQKLHGSRSSMFAQTDQPALQSLPAARYELARFRAVKVHIDYHVEVEGHRYSVPHSHVGQNLEARITARAVEVLLRGVRVATHVRSDRRGGFTTDPEHLPAAHRAHLQWTPQRLIEWGQRIGVSTGEVVTRLLHQHKHPEHGYRACLGLLSLARRHGPQRLEAACERALAIGVHQYRHVRDILTNWRERTELHSSDWSSPAHTNVRGPDYYQ